MKCSRRGAPLLARRWSKVLRNKGSTCAEARGVRLEPAFMEGDMMDPHMRDGCSLQALRMSAESEVRNILNSRYQEQVDPGIPVKYYLDFRTDSRLMELKEVLERMESGTFGRCILCRQPLEEEQLKELLVTKLCEACAGGRSNARK